MREGEGLPDGGVPGWERRRGLRLGGQAPVQPGVLGLLGAAQSDRADAAGAVDAGSGLLDVAEDTPRGAGTLPGPEAHHGAAVPAAVAGGAVEPVAVVGPGGADGAVGGVVGVTGVPAAVHREEGVPHVRLSSPTVLRSLLSLGELVETPLDVEQLGAGLVLAGPALDSVQRGVGGALQWDSVKWS